MDAMVEELQRHQRALDEQAAREQAERDKLNAEARAQWRAKLQAERDAKAADLAREQDAALAADKARLQREWEASHAEYRADPGAYERLAWPLDRQNLIEAAAVEAYEAQKAALRRQGGYSL
jgi:hypothetical protein